MGRPRLPVFMLYAGPVADTDTALRHGCRWVPLGAAVAGTGAVLL
ncbi:hypothetical protein [Streptomyces sp. NPDC088261]